MYGQNPKRAPELGDGQVLQVQEIFPTLQGEGPHAGVPAVFVRLGGCNLACDFCDTEFESFSAMALAEVLVEVASSAASSKGEIAGRPGTPTPALPPGGGGRKLIVITGGEPLRQNIAPLCEALIAAGFTVQVETNGTLMRALPDTVQLVCSPKHTGGGYIAVREDVLSRCIAVKFIVSATHPHYREVAEIGQARYAVPVYIQPMDEGDAMKNAANLAHAVRLVEATPNARLSLQLHKILGMR